MKKLSFFATCLLVALKGSLAFADLASLRCNESVTLGRNGCDGKVTLTCNLATAYVSHNLKNCGYYKLDGGDWAVIQSRVLLRTNNVYQEHLVSAPGAKMETVITLDTAFNSAPGPKPPTPVPPAPVPPKPIPPIPVPSPSSSPAPEPLACRASNQVSRINPHFAELKVSCNQNAAVMVSVFSPSGQMICGNYYFVADQFGSVACNFGRNPLRRTDYTVQVFDFQSRIMVVNEMGVVFKDASHYYPVTGLLMSDAVMKPMPQDKIAGRGTYWSINIKAQVGDQDVDPTEGRRLIKIEAIVSNNKGSKVLETLSSNSGETVEFHLEHEFIKPIVFGKPHDSDEGFVRGENTVTIRVYDAYEGTTYVDLAPVKVIIM